MTSQFKGLIVSVLDSSHITNLQYSAIYIQLTELIANNEDEQIHVRLYERLFDRVASAYIRESRTFQELHKIDFLGETDENDTMWSYPHACAWQTTVLLFVYITTRMFESDAWEEDIFLMTPHIPFRNVSEFIEEALVVCTVDAFGDDFYYQFIIPFIHRLFRDVFCKEMDSFMIPTKHESDDDEEELE